LPFREALANLERQMAEHLARQGQRIRQAREAQNLSQEDAAHLLEVSVKTFGSWERGESEPRGRNWQKLEKVLGVRVLEIRGAPPPSQLDRIEAAIAALAVEQAAIEARLTEKLSELGRARSRGTASKRKGSRTGS
jgi:transcriptional regulator with XRE-family HTH domain